MVHVLSRPTYVAGGWGDLYARGVLKEKCVVYSTPAAVPHSG